MTYTIQLSVRSLVEHVFLSGSIDSGFRAASSMMDGTKAHQRVQEAMERRTKRKCICRPPSGTAICASRSTAAVTACFCPARRR